MEKEKFDQEMATAEFERYCEANFIDHDESAMNDEDLKDFQKIKSRFVKACREGRITVDGTGLEYKVSGLSGSFSGDMVKVTRPSGQAFMAMEGFKDGQQIHRLQAFCSAMTGKEIKYFTRLDIVDWYFFRDIASLFLTL